MKKRGEKEWSSTKPWRWRTIWIPASTLDQGLVPTMRASSIKNRGFARIGCSFDRHARLEVGYLNPLIQTFVQTRTGRRTDLRVNHILSMSLFLNF